MDRSRHFARGTAHAPVGHQGHPIPPALQHRQRRGELVQLRHAIGLRALPTHHTHHIAVERARIESLKQCLLRVKHPSWCLDQVSVLWHRRNLDHSTPQGALQQLEAATGAERLAGRAHHTLVL